ncbi:HNH endonuclease [Laceyella sacchari]|jgi:hypothetical protein|uniref:HNH endonuclease n=2 Tax=Laceyella TaxID=292635 RepID=A0AA45WPU2_9BACL|nr:MULTISPECIES: HNH endonuclease [Laceyella]PRZ12668.1 HNH endonuclease [Laceyella sediminis]TCW39002.1 HNH endonuclease [Laceyella sacchari]SMP22363.1 HNH endonuclease [Laceyella tengchongensis]
MREERKHANINYHDTITGSSPGNRIVIPERGTPHFNAKPIEVEIDKDGHWIFCGHNPKLAKPQIRRGGRVVYVHRYIYELYNGQIPDGYRLTSTCGNKHCVNPNHNAAKRPAELSPVLGRIFRSNSDED